MTVEAMSVYYNDKQKTIRLSIVSEANCPKQTKKSVFRLRMKKGGEIVCLEKHFANQVLYVGPETFDDAWCETVLVVTEAEP